MRAENRSTLFLIPLYAISPARRSTAWREA
jgi:hypothetical protein